jgi:predicted RNase H-like HicB family nuclease
MHIYTAIVHHDQHSAFGLTFPDVPGCFAASDTWGGIAAAATEALDLWFEDQPDVVPASLDKIVSRPEVQEAIAAGGVPMLVPYIPADTTVERINITMERGLLRAIDGVAKQRKMNRSAFLASAARRELTGAS